MLFFFHLLTGLLIGVALAILVHDRNAIPVAGVAAVLPDLVDKPIGHILLAGSLNSGRLICHGLLFAVAVLLAGIILLRWKGTWLGIAAFLGVFSHQVLDFMWRMPINWLFPFLGPYPPGQTLDYFSIMLWVEFSTPYEWAALLGCLGIGYLFWSGWLDPVLERLHIRLREK